MRYRLFQYPLPSPPELDDLNAYLAANRVASVTQQFVPSSGGTMLVFVVQTISGALVKAPSGAPSSRPDYRELLNETDFAVFNKLRQERKKWSEAEGVPPYVVFTNEQLAEMIRQRVQTREGLQKIEGIGAGRVEKYGAAILLVLSATFSSSTKEKIDETDQQPF